MTLLHDPAPSRATRRQTLQPPLRVQIADEIHCARNVRSLREPIDPLLLGALIVVATLAAGLLLGGLWSFVAAHPIPLDVPYYVT